MLKLGRNNVRKWEVLVIVIIIINFKLLCDLANIDMQGYPQYTNIYTIIGYVRGVDHTHFHSVN